MQFIIILRLIIQQKNHFSRFSRSQLSLQWSPAQPYASRTVVFSHGQRTTDWRGRACRTRQHPGLNSPGASSTYALQLWQPTMSPGRGQNWLQLRTTIPGEILLHVKKLETSRKQIIIQWHNTWGTKDLCMQVANRELFRHSVFASYLILPTSSQPWPWPVPGLSPSAAALLLSWLSGGRSGHPHWKWWSYRNPQQWCWLWQGWWYHGKYVSFLLLTCNSKTEIS